MHLIEFEDLPGIPRAVRDGGTDLLDLLFGRVGFYRALAPRLIALMEATGTSTLVDLCSGGGGGALAMRAEMERLGRRDVDLLLTDRYPSEAAIARIGQLRDARVRYRAESVDALDAPRELRGIRTIFGALHHFVPTDAQRLMQSAVDASVPIALFDVAASPTLRKFPVWIAPFAALVNMLALFVVALLLVPLVRPFRWSRVLLTYVVPLIPLLFAWDGTVSALRAYTPEELLAMTRAVRGGERYDWEAGRAGSALYLVGREV